MRNTQDFNNRSDFKKLKRAFFLTGLVIFIENITRTLWIPLFWTLGFLGLWLTGIPESFNTAVRVFLLLLYLTGLFYSCMKGRKHLRQSGRQAIIKRLEQSSHLKHRPLSALEDRLAVAENKTSRALWEWAKKTNIKALRYLRLPLPNPLIAEKDIYGLRLLAVLLFVSGLAIAGQNWERRILDGLVPLRSMWHYEFPKTIIASVIPPEYTNMDKITLRGPAFFDNQLTIPTGSTLKILAKSTLGKLSLKLGEKDTWLHKINKRQYGVEVEINSGDTLTVSQYYIPRLSVPLHVIPDHPPRIELVTGESPDEEPKTHFVLPEGTIRFPLSVYDDYSVKEITMRMTLDPIVEEAPLGYPAEETRSVMSPPKKEFSFEPVYDFTANPWAGLPALIEFTVTDHLGQTDKLGPVKVVLPERTFRHPVAKKIIELRKMLAWTPQNPPEDLIISLNRMLRKPAEYQHDLVVFLALRSAASRLKYAKQFKNGVSLEDAKSVISLLWDTALRIEDGNLSLAARNLRNAQHDLENALRDENTSENEILELSETVRAYLQEYLAELQKELQKRIEEGHQLMILPPELLSDNFNPGLLDEYMKQLESELLEGNRDKAHDMLSELQQLLDSLNPSITQNMPHDMQLMQQGVNELQQLINRQEELLEQTQMQAKELVKKRNHAKTFGKILNFDPDTLKEWEAEDIPPPPTAKQLKKLLDPQVDTRPHKAEQEALRYVLGQLMIEAGEFFDDIPENLGLAEIEMRGASEALGKNAPQDAVPHQEQALEYLKESQEQMQQQVAQKLRQLLGRGGMRLFALPGFRPDQLDPLGRPFSDDRGESNPFQFYAPIEIPDQTERRRVEEILEILRDRSGELDRPAEELEYLRRLLRQF